MSKMIRAALVTGVLFLLVCSLPTVAATAPIKIGAVVAMTGEKASNDVRVMHGMQLAAEEINAKGGINGRTIKLIFEDSQGTASGAVNAFQKIVNEHPDVVAIFGMAFSFQMLAVEPYVREIGIPVVTGSSNPLITGRGNPWVFRVRANDNIVASAAAKYAVEGLKGKRIGVIHNLDEFGLAGSAVIKQVLTEMGNPPVLMQGYNAGDKDFSGQLLNFKKAGVDVVISWSFALEGGLILRQVKQLGLDVKFVGSPSHGQPMCLDLAKADAEGMYVVSEFVSTNPEPKMQAFVEKYRKKFRNEEPDYNSVAYYDGLYMISECIAKVGDDRAAIRDAMHKVKNYPGVMGEYSFNEAGDGLWQLLIVQIKSGKPELVDVVKVAR